MKILGIDPGSAICGWGVVEKDTAGKLRLVDCGCVKTTSRHSTAERLKLVYDGIADVIEKFQPDEVAVEELFFVQNVKTGIVVGQARGVLLLAAANAGRPVFEYKPTQIKMALVGYGRAEKKQVQDMVKLILKLDEPIKQDDTADAVAVAICHLQSRNSIGLRSNIPTMHANPVNGHAKIAKSPRENTELIYPDLSYAIVGALFSAFKQLGPGLPERYYYSVVAEQLKKRNLSFTEQQKVDIEGLPARDGRFFMDFLVEDKVVVELKVGSRFLRKDITQVMNYLRQTNMRLGIIARFAGNGVVTKRLLLGNKI